MYWSRDNIVKDYELTGKVVDGYILANKVRGGYYAVSFELGVVMFYNLQSGTLECLNSFRYGNPYFRLNTGFSIMIAYPFTEITIDTDILDKVIGTKWYLRKNNTRLYSIKSREFVTYIYGVRGRGYKNGDIFDFRKENLILSKPFRAITSDISADIASIELRQTPSLPVIYPLEGYSTDGIENTMYGSKHILNKIGSWYYAREMVGASIVYYKVMESSLKSGSPVFEVCGRFTGGVPYLISNGVVHLYMINGYEVLLDEADFLTLPPNSFIRAEHNNFKFKSIQLVLDKRTFLVLGRYLLGVVGTDGILAYRNGNPLDLRRSNLVCVDAGVYRRRHTKGITVNLIKGGIYRVSQMGKYLCSCRTKAEAEVIAERYRATV